MGNHKVKSIANKSVRATFIRHLLNDIKALEEMENQGLIENDIRRIGAEQEFCLVNKNWRPSKKAEKILEQLDDSHFTTELARYNLEINLDPFELKSNCFTKVENHLKELLLKANRVAHQNDTNVVITGILPTISKNELEFEYMTPNPRYWALNDITKALRGSDFELHLRGVDELSVIHDSVLFEACNTSFQMHLQIPSDDFISSYNWAQAIAGSVLAVCTNSPLLLGRELWSETRIALFQQSIDTRSSSYALKDQLPRVAFGNEWSHGAVADIFKDDIAKHKVILSKEINEDSIETLNQGKTPKLKALCLHNGTIYRWNRPCYGVMNGKAHLRIENRYIPSGPTIIDQMANFAFWVGLMMGRPEEFDDLPKVMDFREAKANFFKAARTGKESIMKWKGEAFSVKDLINKKLLPIAYEGLRKVAISEKDIERLLGVIASRTQQITGSQWKVKNYRLLRKTMKRDDALLVLTKAIYTNQQSNTPIYDWPMLNEATQAHEAAYQVGHIMSTQLFTVNKDDLAELATSMMDWKSIHHVPVEDGNRKLCGLLTWTHMNRYKSEKKVNNTSVVSDIMAQEVITVEPKTEIKRAIAIMKKNVIGCLPVVHKNHLVGIITIKDVLPFDK